MAVEALAAVPAEGSDAGQMRFRDSRSGHVFVVGTPQADGALWQGFMDGALAAYRRYDVEVALEYDRVINGRSTAMFIAGVDESGRVVGGLRVQGPYSHADESHAVATEWRGQRGEHALRRMIADRSGGGVVELKAGWVAHDAEHRRAVREAVARCIVHATNLMGVRYGFLTADRDVAPQWAVSGGKPAWWIPSAPYPDERYRTVSLWWDMKGYRSLADVNQRELIDVEHEELARFPPIFPAQRGPVEGSA
ncbi:hypothetical protein [Nocardia sp. NPDC005825]|uniref:hypothetical protein n=1 Tax=unclassified Nocardia TaxID=2637762 RepID=UPI00340B2945